MAKGKKQQHVVARKRISNPVLHISVRRLTIQLSQLRTCKVMHYHGQVLVH